PGVYSAQLTIGDTTFTESFQVLKDPRVDASGDDLAAQFEFGLKIRDAISRMNEAIIELRDARTQLEGWEKRLATTKETQEARTRARDLITHLTGIEEEFVNTKSSSRM